MEIHFSFNTLSRYSLSKIFMPYIRNNKTQVRYNSKETNK